MKTYSTFSFLFFYYCCTYTSLPHAGVCLCGCALVSVCAAVGMLGVLRLLCSDAGGQVMR